MKKPSKAEAFDSVQTLRASIPETDPNRIHIENLYAFFIPSAPKAKKPEAWVYKAINPKHDSEALRYMLNQDGWLVATDGHRLHALKTELPPVTPAVLRNAAYDVVPGLTADQFPDWRRVIPAKTHQATWSAADCPKVSVTDKVWVYNLPSGHIVNASFWDDAVNGAGEATYSYADITSALVIETETTLAVVMPRRK